MATFKNEKMLLGTLNVKLNIALDNTLDRALEELKRIINENVYGWESPAENPWSPNRTFEFMESWQKVRPIIVGKMMVGEISQAIEVMQKSWIGNVEVHGDRDDLASIIENGLGYNFGHAEGVPREFWQPFIDWINLNLEQVFFEEMNKVGLPVTRNVGVL